MAGLTLAQVSRVAHISTSELSRIERGDALWVTVGALQRFAAAVGLDLWAKTYPGGEPLRDIAHLRLTDAFRTLLGPDLVIRAEVPIGDPRDLRAWDLTLTEPAGLTCGVELETRLIDAQDQLPRLHRKLADGALDRVLLVLADTPANRAALQAAASLLSTTFAINDPEVFDALARGRIPPRHALILVRVGGLAAAPGVTRSRRRPARTNRALDPVGRQPDSAEAPGSGIPAAARDSRHSIPAAREEA